jgi:hypothetical protein
MILVDGDMAYYVDSLHVERNRAISFSGFIYIGYIYKDNLMHSD